MFVVYKENKQHFLRIVRSENLVASVQKYCETNKIHAGWIQGLGACDRVIISYYNLEKKEYEKEELTEEFELLSLVGNISLVDGKPFVHAHVTLGRRNKEVIGGHLHEMRISGTGEVLITGFATEFARSKDEETGLSLLDGENVDNS